MGEGWSASHILPYSNGTAMTERLHRPTRSIPRMTRAVVACALAGIVGCGARPAPTPDGTVAMADTLARMYAQALVDPRRNAFLNGERATALRAVVARESGPAALQMRFLLGQELLLAGQTREAIAELEGVLRSADLTLDAKSPQNKPFFDLLAIAYLRLGEQENCNLNPSANMCILPFDGPARHAREEGAREAIKQYERLLRAFPTDRGSEWLLNIAYTAERSTTRWRWNTWDCRPPSAVSEERHPSSRRDSIATPATAHLPMSRNRRASPTR